MAAVNLSTAYWLANLGLPITLPSPDEQPAPVSVGDDFIQLLKYGRVFSLTLFDISVAGQVHQLADEIRAVDVNDNATPTQSKETLKQLWPFLEQCNIQSTQQERTQCENGGLFFLLIYFLYL